MSQRHLSSLIGLDMQHEPEASLKPHWPWSLLEKAQQVVNHVSALEKLS
jgi:hypothetical protein